MTDATKHLLKVFLCHASVDKPRVRELYQYLQQHGVKPWLDEMDLLPGQDWREEIPKALNSSDVIIVCLSKNSVDKEGYVQKEIRFALDKAEEKPEGRIFVVPAKLEECNVPARLSKYQWVDLFREGGHEQLMRSLNLIDPSLVSPKVSRWPKIIIALIGCGCLLIAAAVMVSMLRPLSLANIFANPTWTLTPSSSVVSTFDQDTDGWNTEIGADPPIAEAGIIHARDNSFDSNWYWIAPAKFLGDKSSFYGGSLSFRLRKSGGTEPALDTKDHVLLIGHNSDTNKDITLAYTLPTFPTEKWNPYSIRLNEDGGWRNKETNTKPTQSEMKAVLANVVALKIYGDYYSDLDISYLDDIKLIR